MISSQINKERQPNIALFEMLLIIVVLGIFLVNTSADTNTIQLSLSPEGILTPAIKRTFQMYNQQFPEHMEWDDALAIAALQEAESKHSSGEPLVTRSELNFYRRESTLDRIDLLAYIPDTMGQRQGWLRLLPVKTRVGCNGIVKSVFGPPKEGVEVTVVCVYKPK